MKLTVAFVLTLWIALAGCGGSNSSTTATANLATGAWTEALTNTSGQQLGSFSFNMTQNNTTLSGSNMNFANMGSLVACFGDGAVMSGQMGPGMMKRRLYDDADVMDTVRQYSYEHYDGAGNMATGMESGSGTFTLNGQTSGCASQTGNFTMTHMSSNMM